MKISGRTTDGPGIYDSTKIFLLFQFHKISFLYMIKIKNIRVIYEQNHIKNVELPYKNNNLHI